MFRSLNIMFISLLDGMTYLCLAFGNITKWSEETSGVFLDQARLDRQKQLIAQEREVQALISQA
jgi:hypothetical protein